jgi:SAM-dependent methyltransferase
MSQVTYDKHYRADPRACGEPFKEFVRFVEQLDIEHADILDIGCGQGRDAFLFAHKGHTVLGIDVSEVGIAQMIERAAREAVAVRGIVADIVIWEPTDQFDVVLIDRVLHMLADDDERAAVLDKAATATREGGFVLIADGPKHREVIRGFFVARSEDWTLIKDTKNRLFARKAP